MHRIVLLPGDGIGQIVLPEARRVLEAVGFDADYSLVDLGASRVIDEDWLTAKCGWSPFTGRQVTGWPAVTVIRGEIVMREDELIGEARGEPLRFWETIDAG